MPLSMFMGDDNKFIVFVSKLFGTFCGIPVGLMGSLDLYSENKTLLIANQKFFSIH